MPLTAKAPQDNFELIPAGVYPATCIAIFDLGTQHSPTYGISERLIVTWELAEMKTTEGKPITISKEYTNSLHEKANLSKDLEAWRGRAFTTDERTGGFDVFRVLKAPCQLQIIHVEKNRKEYANISNIMALPKGSPSPTYTLTPQKFAFEDSIEPSDTVPEWILKKIKSSMNYARRHGDSSFVPPCEGDLEPF
jgi:hypothetical protein